MTKKEALKVANVAYRLLLCSYGIEAVDSGTLERLSTNLGQFPKVAEYLPYFVATEEDEETKKIMTQVFTRNGLEVIE